MRPFHPLKLEVRAYIPLPGDFANNDYAHLSQDIMRSWGGYNPYDKMQYAREMYIQSPVLLSLIRKDGNRLNPFRGKCLGMGNCLSCCADGMDAYKGKIPDDFSDLGTPNRDPVYETQKFASASQPICGGGCSPQINMYDQAGSFFARLQGPCCFGGYSDLCRSYQFPVSGANSAEYAADVAMVTKRRPASWAAAYAQTYTNADNFTVEFSPNAQLDNVQKLSILSMQLLATYTLFETTKPSPNHNHVCYCSVFGCLIPVCIPCGGQ